MPDALRCLLVLLLVAVTVAVFVVAAGLTGGALFAWVFGLWWFSG